MPKILVLGAGIFGTAIAHVLSKNNSIDVWSYSNKEIENLNKGIHKNLENINYSSQISFFHKDISAIGEYDYIFIALPSQNIREHISQLKFRDKQFIILSKGLEKSSLKRISEVLNEYNILNVTTLYGPTHAKDLLSESKSVMSAASLNIDNSIMVKRLFKNTNIQINVTNNLEFAEFFSSMKNAYAIAYGIVSEITRSENTKSAIFSYALMEIEKFMIGMNVKVNFIQSHAIGDLLITSMKGRNRTFGELLAKGNNTEKALKNIKTVVEGVDSILSIKKIADKKGIELKLNNLLYSIVYENCSPAEIFKIFEE